MKNRILIVDDSRYMRKTINEAVTKAGFEVVGEAANGEAAIDLAFELVPDFITLDNILPDMVGIDVLKAIKSDESLANSKVIMVSAVGQQSIINEGLALGASDYLIKPFTTNEIVSSIQKASQVPA
ncbi:MAG: response regulator [Bacteroidota bacterium]